MPVNNILSQIAVTPRDTALSSLKTIATTALSLSSFRGR